MIRVQAQDNNENRYLVCFKWYLDSNWSSKWYSLVVSRSSTYKWYLTNGTHEDSECSRNEYYCQILQSGSILENSFKWYHIPTHGIFTWYHSCKTMVSQVILNFKWSNQAMLPSSSSDISSEWHMLWHRGRSPTDWYQGQRSYVESQEQP
jgi:hypothetical protein